MHQFPLWPASFFRVWRMSYSSVIVVLASVPGTKKRLKIESLNKAHKPGSEINICSVVKTVSLYHF